MDVDPADSEPPAAAAAAQPSLQLEAVVVDTEADADAVRAQESAPLASASLANTMTVVDSATTDIAGSCPARTHLWFVFLFVMLLRDCVCLFRSCRKQWEIKDTRRAEHMFAPAAEAGRSIHVCWRVCFA